MTVGAVVLPARCCGAKWHDARMPALLTVTPGAFDYGCCIAYEDFAVPSAVFSLLRNGTLLSSILFLLLTVPCGMLSAGEQRDFSWRQCSGQSLRIMLSRHPYADGIKRKIRDFEELTGIKVAYAMHPEDRYFGALDQALTSTSGKPDVFMTGVYQVWEYAYQNRMLPLDPFILNPSLTRQGYNINDFFPGIAGSFRWNRKAGAKLGDGPLWAIPIGFEACAITYNREILAKHRLPVPSTMEEMLETGRALNHFEGEGTYGIAARGIGEWNSVHSGYITAFVNYGAKDMEIENGRLVSKVNSPEAVAVTELWVTMLQECGAPDWEYYDWYRCLDDIGERKAALLFDSDIVGYLANAPGASSQSGKLGLAPPPIPRDGDQNAIKSNLWVWGLSINPESRNHNAAWLFVQYFTSREFQAYSVLEWKSVNPPRRSVFEDPAFQNTIASMHGYSETFSNIVENTTVYFTPNPYFFDISERWAAVIRDIANGMYSSTQEGMDTLKVWMDNKLANVSVE